MLWRGLYLFGVWAFGDAYLPVSICPRSFTCRTMAECQTLNHCIMHIVIIVLLVIIILILAPAILGIGGVILVALFKWLMPLLIVVGIGLVVLLVAIGIEELQTRRKKKKEQDTLEN